MKKPLKTNKPIDLVNNPPHYTFNSIECIDAIENALTEEQFIGFLKGQMFRYIWRSDRKDNRLIDLEKCQWYQDKLLLYLKQRKKF